LRIRFLGKKNVNFGQTFETGFVPPGTYRGSSTPIGHARNSGRPKSAIDFLAPGKSAIFAMPDTPKTAAKSSRAITIREIILVPNQFEYASRLYHGPTTPLLRYLTSQRWRQNEKFPIDWEIPIKRANPLSVNLPFRTYAGHIE